MASGDTIKFIFPKRQERNLMTYTVSEGWLTNVSLITIVAEPPPSKLMAFTTPYDINKSANSYKLILQYKMFTKFIHSYLKYGLKK